MSDTILAPKQWSLSHRLFLAIHHGLRPTSHPVRISPSSVNPLSRCHFGLVDGFPFESNGQRSGARQQGTFEPRFLLVGDRQWPGQPVERFGGPGARLREGNSHKYVRIPTRCICVSSNPLHISVQPYIYVSRMRVSHYLLATETDDRLDDPVVWGVLPARFYRDSRRTRWTLGAADIMFTNPCVPLL